MTAGMSLPVFAAVFISAAACRQNNGMCPRVQRRPKGTLMGAVFEMAITAKTLFRPQRGTGTLLLVLLLIPLCITEPALANKFETIGGGLAGSAAIKRDWLGVFFGIASGVSAFIGLLAVFMPHQHAAFLNHATWKQSAAVLFSLAGVFLLLAVTL